MEIFILSWIFGFMFQICLFLGKMSRNEKMGMVYDIKDYFVVFFAAVLFWPLFLPITLFLYNEG